MVVVVAGWIGTCVKEGVVVSNAGTDVVVCGCVGVGVDIDVGVGVGVEFFCESALGVFGDEVGLDSVS